jgi:hypothetical protein
MSASPSNTLPLVGPIKRFIHLINVDFPDPESPMTTNTSPGSAVNDTLLTAARLLVRLNISSLSNPSCASSRASSGASPKIL